MRYTVDVVNRQFRHQVNRRRLAAAAVAVLRAERAPAAQIEIAVVSDREIALLNRRFLGHRGATDVLAFDLSDPGDRALLGQVVVSAETAKRQAESLGHSIFAELALYATHGILHLLGYDDRTPAARGRMHARQRQLLDRLGLRLADRG